MSSLPGLMWALGGEARGALPMGSAEQVMRALLRAILETVQETGETPEGPMYLALSSRGMSLEQFHEIIGELVFCGFLERRPMHCVRITEKGAAWVGKQVTA